MVYQVVFLVYCIVIIWVTILMSLLIVDYHDICLGHCVVMVRAVILGCYYILHKNTCLRVCLILVYVEMRFELFEKYSASVSLCSLLIYLMLINSETTLWSIKFAVLSLSCFRVRGVHFMSEWVCFVISWLVFVFVIINDISICD